MRRINFLAAILVAGVAGAFMFASAAQADTIAAYAFGATSQSVTLTSDGSGGFTAQLGSGTSTYTLSPPSGLHQYNSNNSEVGEASETSTFSITTDGTISFGSNNGSGIFAAAPNSTSTLTITDGNEPAGESNESFSGTITWSYFKDGSSTPSVYGTAKINGITYLIDFQLKSIGSKTLGTWAAGDSGSVSAVISSGELDLASEPMALLLMMFGFAMIGLVAIRRRPATAERLA